MILTILIGLLLGVAWGVSFVVGFVAGDLWERRKAEHEDLTQRDRWSEDYQRRNREA